MRKEPRRSSRQGTLDAKIERFSFGLGFQPPQRAGQPLADAGADEPAENRRKRPGKNNPMHDFRVFRPFRQLMLKAHDAEEQRAFNGERAVRLDRGEGDLQRRPLLRPQGSRAADGKLPVDGGGPHFRVPDRPSVHIHIQREYTSRIRSNKNLFLKPHNSLPTSSAHLHAMEPLDYPMKQYA